MLISYISYVFLHFQKNTFSEIHLFPMNINMLIMFLVPRHDPGPELLQLAVTLPRVVFKMETVAATH